MDHPVQQQRIGDVDIGRYQEIARSQWGRPDIGQVVAGRDRSEDHQFSLVKIGLVGPTPRLPDHVFVQQVLHRLGRHARRRDAPVDHHRVARTGRDHPPDAVGARQDDLPRADGRGREIQTQFLCRQHDPHVPDATILERRHRDAGPSHRQLDLSVRCDRKHQASFSGWIDQVDGIRRIQFHVQPPLGRVVDDLATDVTAIDERPHPACRTVDIAGRIDPSQRVGDIAEARSRRIVGQRAQHDPAVRSDLIGEKAVRTHRVRASRKRHPGVVRPVVGQKDVEGHDLRPLGSKFTQDPCIELTRKRHPEHLAERIAQPEALDGGVAREHQSQFR